MVCSKIGLAPLPLPKKIETKRRHYSEYYDQQTKQIVADRYSQDIKIFGYDFERNKKSPSNRVIQA